MPPGNTEMYATNDMCRFSLEEVLSCEWDLCEQARRSYISVPSCQSGLAIDLTGVCAGLQGWQNLLHENVGCSLADDWMIVDSVPA